MSGPQWVTLLGSYTGPDQPPEVPSDAPPAPEHGATVYADELRRALKIVRPACGTHSMIQALSGVLINIDADGAALTCDSLQGACRVPLSAAGRVETLVMLPALEAAVSDAEGVVTITAPEEAIFAFERFTVRLQQLRREDFPAQIFDGTTILTAGERFANLVRAAAVSASTDEERPVLCSVYLDGQRGVICTSDSYRMFLAALSAQGEWPEHRIVDVVALVKAVKDAEEMTLKLTVGKEMLLVERSDRTWRVPLIDGQFPDYEKLVPEKFDGQITFARADAARALMKIVRVIRDRDVPARLTFYGDRILMVAGKPDHGEVRVEIPAEGTAPPDGPEFGVNPQMLLQGVQTCGTSSRLELHYIAPLRPLLLVDGETRYLQMPVRL